MKQMKLMGYSATLLILFCLTSTEGFLETYRTDNSRNFFGSIWQRSSGILDERKAMEGNRKFIETLRERRQMREVDSDRQDVSRQLARREIRSRSVDDFRRQDIRLADRSREVQRESRQLERREIRSGVWDSRQLNNRHLTERREIRLRSVDNSRHPKNINKRDLHQLDRRISTLRHEINSRRFLATENERTTRQPQKERLAQKAERQLDRRISTKKREVRLTDSSGRILDERLPRQRNTIEDRDSRQRKQNTQERREVRSRSVDRSRQFTERSREARLHSSDRIRETHQQSRQREDRSRETIKFRQRDNLNNRQEIRLALSDRIRQTEHQSRQLREREVRSKSTDNSRRFLAIEEERINRQRNAIKSRNIEKAEYRQQNDLNNNALADRTRQLERRQVRSVDDSVQFSNAEKGVSRRQEIRLASSKKIRESEREYRHRDSRLVDNSRQRNINERNQEVRSASLNRIRENERKSRQLDRRVSTERRQIRSTDNSRRYLTAEKTIRQIDNVFDRRQEIRLAPSDRIRENEQLFRQLERRDVESRFVDSSRRFNNINRQNRSVRSASSNRIRELGQLNRRLIRSTGDSRRLLSPERKVRHLDNVHSREQNVRLAPSTTVRQLERRDVESRLVDNSRQANNIDREIRSASSDRIRKTDRDIRQLNRQISIERANRQTVDSRQTNNQSDRKREIRLLSSDRVRHVGKREVRFETSSSKTRSRILDTSRLSFERRDQQIRILDRRLVQENRQLSDATRRILPLSSKDENNNFVERQSTAPERRMATSFNTDVDYIPEIKSSVFINAVKAVLLSFLLAQVVSNSSKNKRNWFSNFVTVTKEKVL